MAEPRLGTLAYFRVEAHRFFELMGTRAFWELNLETRIRAISGLMCSFSRMVGHVPDADLDQATHILDVVLFEYGLRQNVVLFGRAK